MSIQWLDDTQTDRQRAPGAIPWATRQLAAHVPMAVEEGTLPSGRSFRDIGVIAAFILILLALGTALWFLGPLPRVFPLMS